MTNNDILRRLRYVFDIKDSDMTEIFKLSGQEIKLAMVPALMKKEGELGYLECKDWVLESFLDGFIIQKRGRQETSKPIEPSEELPLTNNTILRKLRIALELKEQDMLAVFQLANFKLSKSELSAFFRKQGHRNYKNCGDQVLRNFLNGLAKKYR